MPEVDRVLGAAAADGSAPHEQLKCPDQPVKIERSLTPIISASASAVSRENLARPSRRETWLLLLSSLDTKLCF